MAKSKDYPYTLGGVGRWINDGDVGSKVIIKERFSSVLGEEIKPARDGDPILKECEDGSQIYEVVLFKGFFRTRFKKFLGEDFKVRKTDLYIEYNESAQEYRKYQLANQCSQETLDDPPSDAHIFLRSNKDKSK